MEVKSKNQKVKMNLEELWSGKLKNQNLYEVECLDKMIDWLTYFQNPNSLFPIHNLTNCLITKFNSFEIFLLYINSQTLKISAQN